MSAIIESTIGQGRDGQTGTPHWIERNVLRLGSGPECELRFDFPDIPAHAATIRYRNGQYTIYNRGGEVLQLGDQRLTGEEAVTWRPGETLRLGSEVALKLVVEGDPAPAPRQDDEVLRTYQEKRNEEIRLKSVQAAEAEALAREAREETVKTPARSSNLAGWIAILGLLVLTMALLGLFGFLVMESRRPAAPTFNPRSVVRNLLARSEDLPDSLVPLLQEAQQSVELLDREAAKSRLLRLESEMDRLKTAGVPLTVRSGDRRVDFEESLRAYINEYLSQLE